MRFTSLTSVVLLLLSVVVLRAGETRAEKLSDGYALLFDLADQEKDANGIFIFKTAQEETKTTIKGVAELYQNIDRQLEDWAKADPTLQLHTTHLPTAEVEARKGISSQHTHELFASRTPSFDRLFLVLQWQSIYYSLHLVKALQKLETVPERRAILEQWEKAFDAQRIRVAEEIPLPSN